jgi:hypothetical protein
MISNLALKITTVLDFYWLSWCNLFWLGQLWGEGCTEFLWYLMPVIISFFLFLYRLFLTACSIYSHCHALRNRVFFWKILFLFLTFFCVCVILFFWSSIFFLFYYKIVFFFNDFRMWRLDPICDTWLVFEKK